MKSASLITIVAVLASCSATRKQSAIEFKTVFKNQVFISSMVKLYGKDYSTILKSQDMSGSNNFGRLGVDGYYFNLADSIGKAYADRINNLPKGYLIEGQRTIANFCLSYYISKELDLTTDSIYKVTHRKTKDFK